MSCVSLRGRTYFGASLHITVGVLFLLGFFVDLLGIAEIWHNPYATYFSLIMAFIYILLFIVFGLLIFRGAEKESRRLLKGSIAGFVALQISAFLVYLVILTITSSIRSSRRASHFKVVPTESSDLTGIGTILEEASDELRQNSSVVELDSIPESTVAPSIPEEEVFDEPIVSIYQIIVLLFGAIGTLAYTTVVVMYVKEVTSGAETTRVRPVRC